MTQDEPRVVNRYMTPEEEQAHREQYATRALERLAARVENHGERFLVLAQSLDRIEAKLDALRADLVKRGSL